MKPLYSVLLVFKLLITTQSIQATVMPAVYLTNSYPHEHFVSQETNQLIAQYEFHVTGDTIHVGSARFHLTTTNDIFDVRLVHENGSLIAGPTQPKDEPSLGGKSLTFTNFTLPEGWANYRMYATIPNTFSNNHSFVVWTIPNEDWQNLQGRQFPARAYQTNAQHGSAVIVRTGIPVATRVSFVQTSPALVVLVQAEGKPYEQYEVEATQDFTTWHVRKQAECTERGIVTFVFGESFVDKAFYRVRLLHHP